MYLITPRVESIGISDPLCLAIVLLLGMDMVVIQVASFRPIARFNRLVVRFALFVESGDNGAYQPFRGYALGVLKGRKRDHLSLNSASFLESCGLSLTPYNSLVSTLWTRNASEQSYCFK